MHGNHAEACFEIALGVVSLHGNDNQLVLQCRCILMQPIHPMMTLPCLLGIVYLIHHPFGPPRLRNQARP